MNLELQSAKKKIMSKSYQLIFFMALLSFFSSYSMQPVKENSGAYFSINFNILLPHFHNFLPHINNFLKSKKVLTLKNPSHQLKSINSLIFFCNLRTEPEMYLIYFRWLGKNYWLPLWNWEKKPFRSKSYLSQHWCKTLWTQIWKSL